MNFGGEYSADGPQFGQAARGPIGHPRMALCPCPSRAREVSPPRTLADPERLIGSRRSRRPRPGNVGVEAGFPICPPSGGHHRGTTVNARQDENRARSVNRAEHRTSHRQKSANSVQPWSELAILRSPKKTHDYLRYQPLRKQRFFADSGQNRLFSSRYRKPIREQPTKTSVSHFRGRDSVCLTARDKTDGFSHRASPRARARRRARRAYANGTEPSTASSTCWNR